MDPTIGSDPEDGEILGEMAGLQTVAAPPAGSAKDKLKALAEEMLTCGDTSQPSDKPISAKKRQRLKQLDYYDVYGGTSARASVSVKSTSPVRLADVQALILWVLGEQVCPNWVFLRNKVLVNKVVLVLANGLTQHLYERCKERLPNFSALGQPATLQSLNFTARPVNTASALLNTHLKRKPATDDITKQPCSKKAKSSAPFPPSYYVATLAQMESHGYPVATLDDNGALTAPAGFSATEPTDDPNSDEKMVALDCEMCITEQGFEVTRITLLDGKGGVLLDTLVLPQNPIVDYNTRFSGITKEMLDDCTTSFQDAQAQFLKHVTAETLLVGHALENDLAAMKIVHARCLDTTILYPHPKGPPYKSALKVLTERFLKRKIQSGSHDSVVDAKAALDLVHLKIKHGPTWGTQDNRHGTTKLVDLLSDYQRRSCLVDGPDCLKKFATGTAAAITAVDDDEVASATARQAANKTANYDFIWAQLTELSTFYYNRANKLRQQMHCHPGTKAVADSDGSPHHASSSTPSKDRSGTGMSQGSAPSVVKASQASADVASESASQPCSNSSGSMSQPAPSAGARTDQGLEGAASEQGTASGERYDDDQLMQVCSRLDARIGAIWKSLPPNTLLIVATGQGDTSESKRQIELKYKRQNGIDDMKPWTPKDEDKLAEYLDQQIKCICCCAIKE